MTQENNVSTSAPEAPKEAPPPAPGADVQKPTPPAGEAPAEVEAAETTEQKDEREKSRFQRRLDRQKSARIEAQTEAKLLRERLEKLEGQSKPQQQVAEPKREDFQDDTAYLRAIAKHDAKQAAEETLKADREAQQGKEKQQQAADGSEKSAKAWAERETAFQTATKDYETVVQPFLEEELQSFSKDARMAIVESEVGPALLYHLAKNTAEADRIADLSPARQIAELGKLELKVSMPAKKSTSAPPPANTTTGGKTATKDLGKMTQEEYEAHRKSQGARWAR